MVKIAVRMDDITGDMDWKRFRQVEAILDGYGIKPLLGVVPFNEDELLQREAFSETFQEEIERWKEKGWSFALHGYQHLYSTKKGGVFPLNNFSEFAGVSFEKQKKMIEEGKEQLQSWGLCTSIFMPPAHSFDKNTMKALRENGFTHITDGLGSMPFQRLGITFLPISFRKKKDVARENGYTTVVLHTNTMNEGDMTAFAKLCEEKKEQFIPYSEYLMVGAKKRGVLGNWKEYTMAKSKFLLMKIKCLLK